MFDLQHVNSQCACQEELAMKCTPRKDSECTCWIEWFGTDQMSFAESLAQTIIWVFDIIKVELFFFLSVSLVAQSYPTLWDPMVWSFPVHHQLPELAQIHVHWVSDTIQNLILCHPLLLLLSIFPSLRVFSNESVLCIRWPKYSSFSISPSNEYSRLISFRTDGFDLLAVQGTWVFSNTTVQKHQLFGTQLSLWSNSHIHTWLLEKP